MRKLFLLTVLISAITLVGFWGGKKACMLMWPGSVRPSQAWYFSLGLNPEQAQSLKRVDSAFRKDTDKLCMRVCKERLELLNLMRDPNVKPEVVYKKIEEIGALQVSIEKEIATHILKVKKDLTAEQSEAYLNTIRRELQESIKQSGYGEILKEVPTVK